MIAVRLIGGLGNQMFQYAAGRALAERLGTELLLDTRDFEHYTLHSYGLCRFAITKQVANSAQLSRWPSWIRRGSRLLRRIGIHTRWFNEIQFEYDSAWESIPDGTLIDGYFQSQRYFAGTAESIRREFVPVAPLSQQNANYAKLARDCDSVMIHVRRGDYVTNLNTLKFHGVCSIAYYEASINYIRERLVNPRFFVFSNDMAWAQENLKLGDDAVFVTGNDTSPEIDIHLMAQCRHYIIANSTFSWWGAWLNFSKEKIVIAPECWFASLTNTRDLIPQEWVRIHNH
jgi:hypothetical protein